MALLKIGRILEANIGIAKLLKYYLGLFTMGWFDSPVHQENKRSRSIKRTRQVDLRYQIEKCHPFKLPIFNLLTNVGNGMVSVLVTDCLTWGQENHN